ncbi:hypothetical protein CHUAL_013232 [Chamberlinius hualienensis]
MPWNRRELIQLALLLSCVPLQYLFTTSFNNDANDSNQRDQKLLKLIASLRSFSSHYLRWEPWRLWWLDVGDKFLQLLKSNIDLDDEYMSESPAVEVFHFRNKHGHFASSMDIRSERPSEVLYKIGQVVIHKTLGYRGVIIGWDKIAKAPQSWLKMMHPDGKEHWQEMPNYAVLVDVRDRPTSQMTYVPQENLRLVTNTQIEHPKLGSYFSKFDGQKYVPLSWLRTLYPKDE